MTPTSTAALSGLQGALICPGQKRLLHNHKGSNTNMYRCNSTTCCDCCQRTI